MLSRLKNEERGMAMVLSLMVAFVVLLLTTVVVAQSIHSLNSSGYDRKRLTSINAAEAGTNYWYGYLQATPAASVSCSAVTQTIQSAPSTASFTATPTFYKADGSVLNCPFTSTTYPSYVLVNSVGTTAAGVSRTFQSYMRLSPVRSGFGAAILTNAGTSFGNNFDVYGQSGNDGDVYILQGNLTVTNNPTIRGNVYVPYGSASVGNGATITGDLWARDAVTINLPAVVQGNAYSSNSTLAGTGTIQGNAKAASTIASSLTVGGIKSPNSVVGAVPTQTFPTIGYVASDWTNAGYSIQTFSGAGACTNAYNWIRSASWTSGADVVIRITGATACTFANGTNDTITLQGNLAVISDWGIDLGLRSNWNGTSGTKSVYFVSTAPAASCPASGVTNKNITVGNSTNFDAFTQLFFYTPCTATMQNRNSFSGQVMATNVSIANNYTMTFQPVLVPGAGTITGFTEDISYVREVV